VHMYARCMYICT